jgi:hypothetical protein
MLVISSRSAALVFGSVDGLVFNSPTGISGDFQALVESSSGVSFPLV